MIKKGDPMTIIRTKGKTLIRLANGSIFGVKGRKEADAFGEFTSCQLSCY